MMPVPSPASPHRPERIPSRAKLRAGPRRCPLLLATLLLASGPAAAAGAGEPAAEGPPEGHRRMVALLRQVAEGTRQEDNPFLNDRMLRELRQQVAGLPPEAPAGERLDLEFLLGMGELNVGTIAGAIEHFSRAYGLLARIPEEERAVLRSKVTYYLGLAHMRWGERQNCVARHTAESCLFPVPEGGVHQQQEGARQAIRYLRESFHGTPERSVERVAARWLLNIAYMTAGDYPEAVPAGERIPPARFASEADFPRFRDLAPRLGLDTFDHAGGAVVEDFDGDGLLDVVTSTWEPSGQLRVFRNAGDGTFRERTAEANVTGITGGLNLVPADYDNDGDIDILVLRGAWLLDAGRHPNSLLRNDGGGTFTDVTFDAGLGEDHFPTQTAAWADYDGDGDLDLYIGNEVGSAGPFASQLFRNEGDGTFTDVARRAGVENRRYSKGVAWGDYDGDGRPDLYVSNFMGANRLYHNNGDGTFTDTAPQLGLEEPIASFATWFWDFDNDGALDLYVASYPNGVGPGRLFFVAASYLGLPSPAEPPRLYRGDGQGGFREVAAAQGLTRITMPMGANFGDLDNDGFPDVYLGTGYPAYDGLMPNVLYWNRRGQGFADVTTAAGVGHLQKGHGIAFADLDNDGDQDLFEQMGGFYPEDAFANVLFENPGFGNRWLKVRLRGVRSNRSGIGARIRAEIRDGEERRWVVRHVGSGGSFGANPFMAHLGLGSAARVEVLEVFWPASGTTQVLRGVAAGQAIEITEGEEGYRTLPHPAISFR